MAVQGGDVTAEIISFPTPDNEGNGAVEAVECYLNEIYPARLLGSGSLAHADHFLLWLASEGFLVVSIDELLNDEE